MFQVIRIIEIAIFFNIAVIAVYDVSGKAVFKTTTAVNDGVNNISLHLSSLATGVYTVELKNKEIPQQIKLVIEK